VTSECRNEQEMVIQSFYSLLLGLCLVFIKDVESNYTKVSINLIISIWAWNFFFVLKQLFSCKFQIIVFMLVWEFLFISHNLPS